MQVKYIILLGSAAFAAGNIYGETAAVARSRQSFYDAAAAFLGGTRWDSGPGSVHGTDLTDAVSRAVSSAWRTVQDTIAAAASALAASSTSSATSPSSPTSATTIVRSTAEIGRALAEATSRVNPVGVVAVTVGGAVAITILLTEMIARARVGDGAAVAGDEFRDPRARRYADAVFSGRTPPPSYQPQPIPVAESQATATATAPAACIVCMAHQRDTVCSPCGHLAMCWGCAEQLVAYRHANTNVAVTECPVCRATVSEFAFVRMP